VRAASLLRWAGKSAPAPAQWLADVNVELCKTMQDGRFLCAVVGIYDRKAGIVELASAGFPPALVLDGAHFEELLADGPPLGIIAEASYDQRRIELGRRALYLFSDGATDVRDDARKTLGSDGLRALIVARAELAPEPRLRALIGDLKRMRLVDDTTFLLIQEPCGKAAQRVLEIEFPAQPGEMRAVRAALRAALDGEEVAPELRDRLVLVVDEACTNVMRHAYCGFCDQTIALRVTRERDMLAFEVADHAPPVDPARVRPRDLDECRPGGLGVAFIDSLMDEWRIEPGRGGKGNVLHMRKRITTGEHE
jgi:sigma-B regulation protein RsbU (phosphoserine phosphatase)